ncbi:MAG: isopenicillin N synthase family oxygenase [Gammaproteobacteria bacterium]|nr:isopenicillin N synthase family oxygenase [Gammaproteobacteria bacterium]
MSIPKSRRLDFAEIPVIDLTSLVAGEDNPAVVATIGQACRDVGFIYIKNHGIPQVLIEDVLIAGREFFARPMEEKKQIILSDRIRGYLPLRYSSYKGEAIEAVSNQEGFWIGEDRPINQDNRLDGPNLWPENGEALKQAMESYYTAATDLSQILQRAFSLALGQPAQFFEDLFQRQSSLLKINHYPPQDNHQTVNNIGVVPHTDEIGFTILWQDDNGGLEIESKSGEWVEAPPIPGTFVINLGDLMQIWSDGEFSSTPHRVINRSGAHRFSIPFFANPRWDVPVKPLVGDSGSVDNGENYEQYQVRNWRRIFPIAGVSG